MARAKAKNFSFDPEFLAELQEARRHFIENEPMVWDVLNGDLAPSVLLQMAARLGFEHMKASEAERRKMWEYLPSTARGYTPR